MSSLYIVDPEVCGDWGEDTIVDNQDNINKGIDIIPHLSRLEYCFNVWLGDDLVAGHACFLITERLTEALRKAKYTGTLIRSVDVGVDKYFNDMMEQLHPGKQFPSFNWLDPLGEATLTASGEILEWTGHDFCWGFNRDFKPTKSTEFIGLIPPLYSLVVSDYALKILCQFSLNNCDVEPLTYKQ